MVRGWGASMLCLVALGCGGGRLLEEFPSSAGGAALAYVVTSDDGITPSMRVMARHLAQAGVPSILVPPGVARSTPDVAGARAARLLQAHLTQWHRRDVLLVGADRGAGITTFVANRLNDELRGRVQGLVLLDLPPRVSFAPGWRERLARAPLPTALPVLPELERLRGLPIICLYDAGASEQALCPALDASLMRRQEARPRESDEERGAALARQILGLLR